MCVALQSCVHEPDERDHRNLVAVAYAQRGSAGRLARNAADPVVIKATTFVARRLSGRLGSGGLSDIASAATSGLSRMIPKTIQNASCDWIPIFGQIYPRPKSASVVAIATSSYNHSQIPRKILGTVADNELN